MICSTAATWITHPQIIYLFRCTASLSSPILQLSDFKEGKLPIGLLIRCTAESIVPTSIDSLMTVLLRQHRVSMACYFSCVILIDQLNMADTWHHHGHLVSFMTSDTTWMDNLNIAVSRQKHSRRCSSPCCHGNKALKDNARLQLIDVMWFSTSVIAQKHQTCPGKPPCKKNVAVSPEPGHLIICLQQTWRSPPWRRRQCNTTVHRTRCLSIYIFLFLRRNYKNADWQVPRQYNA